MRIQNRLGLLETTETLLAQERRMSQVSNNLANVNTTGYKKDNQTFWEMLYRMSSGKPRIGKASRVIVDHAEGGQRLTGNPLDLAIRGDGYFKVQTAQGTRYTRAGHFVKNGQGLLTTENGDPVLGEGGPITIEGNEIVLGSNGRVVVDGVPTDQIAIVSFDDPEALEKEGYSLFRATEYAQETLAEDFEVRQGFLEDSNVNSVKEMTEMIDVFRAFETQQKVIRTVDELNDLAARRVGVLTA